MYAFGHGLSYTTFAYDKVALSAASIKAGDTVKASVTVRNSGARDGDEVVQLYVAKPGDTAKPVLAGFSRVHLKAGASQNVTFDLDARALSQVDSTGVRKVTPGRYVVYMGGGQPDDVKAVSAVLTVNGESVLPK